MLEGSPIVVDFGYTFRFAVPKTNARKVINTPFRPPQRGCFVLKGCWTHFL